MRGWWRRLRSVGRVAGDPQSTAEDDARARAQWRERGLTPVTDTSAAAWLTSGVWETRRDAGYPARIRLSNPEGDEYDDIDTLPEPVLAAIAAALARHTRTPERCWFAVWSDSSIARRSHKGSFAFSHARGTPSPPSPRPALPSTFHDGPRAAIGDREFMLFTGPATAAPNMGWNPTPTSFRRTWADLIWPDDKCWLAEFELDDTALDVAGSAALIAELGGIPGLSVDRMEL